MLLVTFQLYGTLLNVLILLFALVGRNLRFEVQKINQGLGSAVEAGLITCNLSETQVQSEI